MIHVELKFTYTEDDGEERHPSLTATITDAGVSEFADDLTEVALPGVVAEKLVRHFRATIKEHIASC